MCNRIMYYKGLSSQHIIFFFKVTYILVVFLTIHHFPCPGIDVKMILSPITMQILQVNLTTTTIPKDNSNKINQTVEMTYA